MPRSERAIPLLGRGCELEELVGHIGVAARGQLRLALVQGEPGIGKSRLLDEVGSRLTAEGFSVRAGQGEELGLLRPMGPILHALGVEAPPPAAGEIPEAWRYRVLQLAIDATESASRDGPVLLVVDDLQWADRASLVFLRALASRVTGRPIGVLAGFRPVPRDPDFNDSIAALVEAGGLRVALGPLDEPAVRALVEAILDTAADEQLLHWTRGAGGNPLFVTELVRSAQDAGRLELVEHRAVLRGDPLPRALSALLDRRIAGLSPETADVLKVAAVLGDGFAPHILAAVMGRSTAAVLPGLDEAIEVEVLFSRGSGLVFRHDLVRDAVYRRIPAALQSSLHLEAASVLSAADAPADVVAAHLLRSGDDPAAVPMLREAAERLAGSAAGAAADLVDRALELMPAGHPDRTSTAVSLVRLLAWAGRPAQAAARAKDALAAGLDAAAEARLRVGLAEAMIFRGLPLGVLEQLACARRLDSLTDAELAPLLAAAAHARLFTGELDAVEQDVRDAVAAADRVGDEASACFALLARTIWLRSRGLQDESLRAAQRNPESRAAASETGLYRTTALSRFPSTTAPEESSTTRCTPASRTVEKTPGISAYPLSRNIPRTPARASDRVSGWSRSPATAWTSDGQSDGRSPRVSARTTSPESRSARRTSPPTLPVAPVTRSMLSLAVGQPPRPRGDIEVDRAVIIALVMPRRFEVPGRPRRRQRDGTEDDRGEHSVAGSGAGENRGSNQRPSGYAAVHG